MLLLYEKDIMDEKRFSVTPQNIRIIVAFNNQARKCFARRKRDLLTLWHIFDMILISVDILMKQFGPGYLFKQLLRSVYPEIPLSLLL